jgi:NAD(P)-dependent dehydrogenase (short-subunit alcohol dehydrogenase family)
MKVNLDGVFYFSRECFPHLAAHADHKGAIVNVSSVACKRSGCAGVPYTTSKHAVVGLTKNTAKHNKGKVTCNAVAPGGKLPFRVSFVRAMVMQSLYYPKRSRPIYGKVFQKAESYRKAGR